MSLYQAAKYWEGEGADVCAVVCGRSFTGMTALNPRLLASAWVNARALEWLAALTRRLRIEKSFPHQWWTVWDNGAMLATAETYHEALAAAVRAVKEQS